jgi:hypothetical protein
VLEQFEKKWKQLAKSLLDRYAIDGIFLSETIKSRQAFIDDTTKRLSAFSAALPTPHTQQEIITLACEKRNNLNRLARLVHLNDLLVKQDETAAELNNYKLNYLAEIIFNFSKIRSQTPLQPESLDWQRREQLDSELIRLRARESDFNPTSLLHTLEVMCEKLKTFNWLMGEKENMSTNSTLTSLEVDLLFKIFSESVKPPRLVDGWPKTWAELYETWNQLKDRLMRLMDNNNITLMMPLKILCERVSILNRLMRLKEMLLKEDHLSAELTYSRVTSLEEIMISFSDMPPLLDEREIDKWNELNKRLVYLRLLELGEARLFSIRSNNEVLSKKGSRPNRKLRTRTEPPPAGPVYTHWLKPPQTAISHHASVSASRTSLPDQHGMAYYYHAE